MAQPDALPVPPPWRRRLATALVVVIALVALGLTAAGQLWLRGQRSDDAAAVQVRTAAQSAVTAVLSYDYRRLQPGIEATTPLLTGDALEQYAALQKPLLRTAPDLEAVVRSEVKVASVLESDDDSARVLLFVDQTSISNKLDAPQLDQSRVVVTLVRTGDRWLVDTLVAV